MSRFALLIAAAALATVAQAAPWPYDEKADAGLDVQHAIEDAKADHKQVLLVFGANWCPDCRALDKAMHGSSQSLLADRFEIVKIDVGNFDKNLKLSQHYGNPIAKGIPAVVVVDADDHLLYSTKGGELANAGQMSERGIYDFLKQKIANRS
jgi:protein disulfide-isomerase